MSNKRKKQKVMISRLDRVVLKVSDRLEAIESLCLHENCIFSITKHALAPCDTNLFSCLLPARRFLLKIDYIEEAYDRVPQNRKDLRSYPSTSSHFRVQNSLNKGPIFRRFSLNMGGFPEIGKELSKIGSFPPKFIIKVGMTATVGNQKRAAF